MKAPYIGIGESLKHYALKLIALQALVKALQDNALLSLSLRMQCNWWWSFEHARLLTESNSLQIQNYTIYSIIIIMYISSKV